MARLVIVIETLMEMKWDERAQLKAGGDGCVGIWRGQRVGTPPSTRPSLKPRGTGMALKGGKRMKLTGAGAHRGVLDLEESLGVSGHDCG
jgi:hypothetical protein